MGVVLPFLAMKQNATQDGAGASFSSFSGPAGAFSEPAGASGRGAPLLCLAGDELAGRFHKWRARSGRAYVFSVFPARLRALSGPACAEPANPLAGLPEFESAVVFGVVRMAQGELRRLPAFEILWLDGRFRGDGGRAAAALRAGATEWHVHLLARDAAARRRVLDDFAD